MGVTEHILQKSQLLKFTYLSWGYIEEKSYNFCSFVSIFIKSHTKTLSEHIIMIILHFLFKNVVFKQKWFHLSKLVVFYRNNSNGSRKHSLKIWAWSDHFSRFHRYWKFKIQRYMSEWCKTFFEEYICLWTWTSSEFFNECYTFFKIHSKVQNNAKIVVWPDDPPQQSWVAGHHPPPPPPHDTRKSW